MMQTNTRCAQPVGYLTLTSEKRDHSVPSHNLKLLGVHPQLMKGKQSAMTPTRLGQVMLVKPLRLSRKRQGSTPLLGGLCVLKALTKAGIIEFVVKRILLADQRRWIFRSAETRQSHEKTTLLLVLIPRIGHSRCTLEMDVGLST